MPPVTRRRLIQTGAAGSILLALAACARSAAPERPAFEDPSYRYRALGEGDRQLFGALAPVMLAGALPGSVASHQHAIVQAVRGVDVAVAGLPPHVVGELHQLFGLLEFTPTRGITTGLWMPWPRASRDDVARFLERWRYSNVALYRSGYQALHQLVMAGWYGNSSAWDRIGYPGPPKIS